MEISFTCETSLVPSFNGINTPFKQMAAIPGKLESEAINFAKGTPEYIQIKTLAAQARTVITTMGDLIDAGLTSVSSPFFASTVIPDQSWDYRVRAMMKEFSIYVPKLLLEMIMNIIPLSPNPLEAPIPLLEEHSIDELFTVEGRAEIKATVATKLEPLSAALSAVKTAYIKDTRSTDFRTMEVFQALIGGVQKYLTEALFSAFELLISTFQEIWDVLGLPEIPAPIFWPDLDSLLDSIVEEAYETKELFINALLDITIPGIELKLGDLMGMTYLDELESSETFSSEKLKNQIKQMAYDYLVLYPLELLQNWLSLITDFLNAVGAVLPFPIPFTFCDMLNVIFIPVGGFPPTLPG